MTALSDYEGSRITKILLGGPSKIGKTTALAPLVGAGYKLRIWDYDDGVGSLVKECKRRGYSIEDIQYVSLRDRYTNGALGPIIVGTPKAFTRGLDYLDRWPDDGSSPEDWGPEYIAVFDSLTHCSNAAYNWSKAMQGSSSLIDGVPTKGSNPQAITYTAQKGVEHMIASLTAESFRTNLILICHWKSDMVGNLFPASIGSALGPIIPTYFNNHFLSFERHEGRRIIRTRSTDYLSLTTSADVEETIPAEDGLLQFFPKRS